MIDSIKIPTTIMGFRPCSFFGHGRKRQNVETAELVE